MPVVRINNHDTYEVGKTDAERKQRSAALKYLPSDGKERFYLLGCAWLLLLVAVVQVLLSSADDGPQERSALDYEGRRFHVAHTYTRSNPDIPFLERVFCSGRRNAFFCSRQNYHPYMAWWNKYAAVDNMNPRQLGTAYSEIQKTFSTSEQHDSSSTIYESTQLDISRGAID